MKKLSLIFITSTFTILSVLSQVNINPIKDTISLEEVIVTGSPVKVNKNNVPMAVTVVNREQISESSESAILPVLNGRVPGLFVTERGVTGFGVSTGAAGQITMRGIGGSPTTGVLILIDGHPQYMGIFGHPLADSYVTSDVEKVEVIRGPASILYGSNAMGGVINIITRKQTEDGFHGNANIMYGSFNTQKYMAAGGYKKNNLSVFASVNHDQTNGHRANSDFNINNGYIKIGYELNKNIRANTDFSIAHFKATDPGPDTTNAKKGNSLDITRGYWAFDLENEFEKFSGVTKLFYNFGEHKISDGFHSKDANYGLNIHESAKLFKGNSISIGADYINYGGKAENELAMAGKGMVFKDTTIYEAAVYGFVQQTLFEKLTLNAGLRLQNHEVYGKQWIPSGGFAFKVAQQTTWKASVSKGFRSPTIQELYIWNHNSNLSPEKIMNYETGILQSFLHNKLNIELTGFIVKGNNLIVNVPLKGLQNAGEVSNKGIEFAANANPLQNLAVTITYSYIDMKNPVYATPKHHLFSSLRYKLNKLSAMASVQYINHLDTDPSTKVYFQNYTLVNTKISYQIWKYAEVFASAENLLNQKYETNRYYTMPGITAFGGVNFKF
jgi:iron complex outermembrane receptor protein